MTTTSGPSLVRIGTRGSRLALRQAEEVSARLAASHPDLDVRKVIVKTTGDRVLDAPLSKIGGKGLFTKELDTALGRGTIDLAVHSLKDLPTQIPSGLAIGAVLEREDPSDVLISASGRTLRELPAGARVGTSSLRRRAQLLALRADLNVVDLRGNVPTRIAKVENGEYDAIVLAFAGVARLGLTSKITQTLGPDELLPAVGQGAIAVEIRAGDSRIAKLVAHLDHEPTRLAAAAERGLLRRLEGGCQVPIGALGKLAGKRLVLEGLVADLDGQTVLRGREEGEAVSEAGAAAIGETLAERLLEMGARDILRSISTLARRVPVPAPSGDDEGDETPTP